MDLKNTKFCQSCGMPMLPGIAYGTEADGSLSGDYCSYCYGSGAFLGEMSMEEMIDFCLNTDAVKKLYASREEGRRKMLEYFPTLKRWKR